MTQAPRGRTQRRVRDKKESRDLKLKCVDAANNHRDRTRELDFEQYATQQDQKSPLESERANSMNTATETLFLPQSSADTGYFL